MDGTSNLTLNIALAKENRKITLIKSVSLRGCQKIPQKQELAHLSWQLII